MANNLVYYLVGINVFSFFLFSIDLAWHARTGKTIKPVALFMLVTILGGALGVNLYFLLFFPSLKRNETDYNDYHAMKDHYSFWRILAFVMLALDVFLIAMAYETGVLDFSSVHLPQLPNFPMVQKLDELNNRYIPLMVWLGLINHCHIYCFRC